MTENQKTKDERAKQFEELVLSTSIGKQVPQIQIKIASGASLSEKQRAVIKSGGYVTVERGRVGPVRTVKVFFSNPFNRDQVFSTAAPVAPDRAQEIGPAIRDMTRKVRGVDKKS